MSEQAQINILVDHLFRHEYGRLVVILSRIFGVENLDLAEDVVQDSLIEAMKLWTYKGIPDNPSAWLFRVAKNKALNIINREKYKKQYSSEVARLIQSESVTVPALDHFFSEKEILDDQLRMIFTCCHPAISPDSQIALALKTLCGFSISEIARAFLSMEESIKKRLVRAKQKIRDHNIPFEVPGGHDLLKRTATVLETIYLLFNEGYSASKGNDLVRFELCEEAMRLTCMLLSHPAIEDKSDVYALLALMQLNASRFRSRRDVAGNLLTMADQDRSQWDVELIRQGLSSLERSGSQSRMSVYYILATISAYHCLAPDFASTNWRNILVLYDNLVEIDNSPLVLLNRAVAVSKVNGPEQSIRELGKIKNDAAMKTYYLLYSTEAEFYMQLNQMTAAAESLRKAIELAPLQVEKELLQKRLDACV